MAKFNADFWEIPTDFACLDRVAAERALWFETEEDRERRYAFEEFYKQVIPVVQDIVASELTARQKEVLRLYFFLGKSQEDIAAILDLSQSTVSRHLFGTVRDGRKIGGAIPKLQKIIERRRSQQIRSAFETLQERLAQPA